MKNVMYFIKLDDLNNFKEYEKYIKLMSYEKQMQIYKYKYDIDKKLCLISDLFVRNYACKFFNVKNSELSFGKNGYGKPYLLKYGDFHYNISHTKNAIAIGFCYKPIGIDVEKISPVDLKIAERFFCTRELDYITSKPFEQNKAFIEVWTKKEAYIKCKGKGLSILLNSFDVMDYKIGKKFNLFTFGDYVISVYTEAGLKNFDVLEVNESQLRQIVKKCIY